MTWIAERLCTGALCPARIVNARNRGMLGAQLRVWIPTRVEQHKDGTNLMLRANSEELVDSSLESSGILLPKEIVKEDAHGVHADSFRPAKFTIDLRRIKSIGLPHLKLVDRRSRKKIASHQPWLVGIPIIGLRFSPAWSGTLSRAEVGNK